MRTIPALATGLAAVAVPLLFAPAAAAQSAGAPVVTHERGYALTCTGVLGPSSVFTELYINSTVPVPASVVVETPTRVLVAADGSAAPTIRKGEVAAAVRLVDRDSGAAAGRAAVRGSYRGTGPVTRVDEDVTDDGQRIQVTGTNQDLRTRLELRHRSRTARLTCSEAFAFDLTVVKTPL